MFPGATATTCDRPGYSCHVNDHKQADGEVYGRVSLLWQVLCNVTVSSYVTSAVEQLYI